VLIKCRSRNLSLKLFTHATLVQNKCNPTPQDSLPAEVFVIRLLLISGTFAIFHAGLVLN